MPTNRRPHGRTLLLTTLVASVLAACAPGTEPLLATPTFRIVADQSAIVRLDLLDAAAPRASLRLTVEVTNPNPVPVRLASVDGDVLLGGVQVAAVRLPAGLDLAARGSARWPLEVDMGSAAIAALGATFADQIAGRPTPVRLDAQVGVDVLGAVQRFPRTTVLAGELRSNLALRPPRVELDRAASGVRSARFDQVIVDLGFVLHNDGPVGVVARAPDLRVELGGRVVAGIQVASTAIPAHGSAASRHELVLNPAALGAALVTELTRLASGERIALEVGLSGAWELGVPGVATLDVPAARVFDGRLE